MIYEDGIQDLLLDHGLIRRPYAAHYSSQFGRMVSDLHSVLAYEMGSTLHATWGTPEDMRWDPTDVLGMDEDEIYQDVNPADIYRCWREELPELNQGPWNTLDADTRTRWHYLTEEVKAIAEEATRDLFRKSADETNEDLRLISEFGVWEESIADHPLLRELIREWRSNANAKPYDGDRPSEDDEDDEDEETKAATAVGKAIAHDVAQHGIAGAPAAYDPQGPMAGDTLFAVVSGKEVPVRILAQVGVDTYSVQNLKTGRKMQRALHQLRSASVVQSRRPRRR